MRRVEDDDLDAARHRRERLREIRDPDRLQWHVDVALNVGVDRDKIILALELQSVAGKINQRDRVRPRGRNLAEELAESFPQCRLIEILRAGDGEARGRERVGNEAGVVGRRRQRAGPVVVVADHQRKSNFLSLAGTLSQKQCRGSDQAKQQSARKSDHHNNPESMLAQRSRCHCTQSNSSE